MNWCLFGSIEQFVKVPCGFSISMVVPYYCLHILCKPDCRILFLLTICYILLRVAVDVRQKSTSNSSHVLLLLKNIVLLTCSTIVVQMLIWRTTKHNLVQTLWACLILFISSLLFFYSFGMLELIWNLQFSNNIWSTFFFSYCVQSHWLGSKYFKRGPEGNDVYKTNVPLLRIAFRHEVSFLQFMKAFVSGITWPSTWGFVQNTWLLAVEHVAHTLCDGRRTISLVT